MVTTVVNKNPVVYMYVLLYFVRGLSIYKVVSRISTYLCFTATPFI